MTRLLDSFGRVPSGDARGRTDQLLAELANSPTSRGLIVLYGTPAEIAARKRYFQNHFGFRGFDTSRIDFRRERNIGDVRSDFWIIPKKGVAPEIKPEAWIEVTFGKVYKKQAFGMIKKFFSELSGHPDHRGYIINYGTPKQVALPEKWVVDQVAFRGGDRSRITLVRGGPGDLRTVIWLVPPGAENPKP